MNPPRSEGFVRMPDAEFEAILTRAAEGEADQKNVQWTFFPPNAKRALADVGLDGDEAALDIRDLRSMLDLLRPVRRTADPEDGATGYPQSAGDRGDRRYPLDLATRGLVMSLRTFGLSFAWWTKR